MTHSPAARNRRDNKPEQQSEGPIKPLTPLQLPKITTVVKYNIRAILSPASICLLLITALISYVSAYDALAGRGTPYLELAIQSAVSRNIQIAGSDGLHPILLMFTYPTQLFLWFLPLAIVTLTYLTSCNLVAQDSGSLLLPLLHSRPVAKGRFLLTGFLIRTLVFLTVGYMIPFIIAYAQNIATIATVLQGTITTYMTMEQWMNMAWNGLLWQFISLFALFFAATASLALLTTILARRGLVALIFMFALTFLLYLITAATLAPSTMQGEPLPLLLALFPPFYLYAAIYSTPCLGYPIVAPIMSMGEATLCLALYTALMLSVSVFLYRRSETLTA